MARGNTVLKPSVILEQFVRHLITMIKGKSHFRFLTEQLNALSAGQMNAQYNMIAHNVLRIATENELRN